MTHFENMVEAQILAAEGQRDLAIWLRDLFQSLSRRLGDLLTRHGKLDPI